MAARWRLLCAAAVAIVVLGLAACGEGGSSSPTDPPTAPPAEPPAAAPAPAVVAPAETLGEPAFTPPAEVVETLQAFIDTAVLRTDLDRAWALAAPELKQGYTLERWRTGTIPVVPFPRADFGGVEIEVLEAAPDDVFLSALVRPRAGSDQLPIEYLAHVVPHDGEWLVGYLAPSGRQAGLPGF